MNSNSSVKFSAVLGFSVLIVVIVAIVFTKNKNNFSSAPAPLSSTVSEPTGVTKAREMIKTYPKLVKRTFITESLEGTLTAFTDKSWTIEKEGEKITLNNESGAKVRYIKLPKNASSSAKPVSTEIGPKELKVGDTISISRTIDWETGASNITVIIIL